MIELMKSEKKVSRNRKVANDFAEKYGGTVTAPIEGNVGRAGYIVEINGWKVYVFLINTWHNNRKAISINQEQLQKAVDDHALILMSYQGREFVIHSTLWELWAKQDNNFAKHPKFDTVEVFCKTDNFRILDLDRFKISDYYPVEL
jgi:hypothetical protein